MNKYLIGNRIDQLERENPATARFYRVVLTIFLYATRWNRAAARDLNRLHFGKAVKLKTLSKQLVSRAAHRTYFLTLVPNRFACVFADICISHR